MYLVEIGRKINSKTICRIKNIFVTLHACVCVKLLLYIFSLSLCTRTEKNKVCIGSRGDWRDREGESE